MGISPFVPLQISPFAPAQISLLTPARTLLSPLRKSPLSSLCKSPLSPMRGRQCGVSLYQLRFSCVLLCGRGGFFAVFAVFFQRVGEVTKQKFALTLLLLLFGRGVFFAVFATISFFRIATRAKTCFFCNTTRSSLTCTYKNLPFHCSSPCAGTAVFFTAFAMFFQSCDAGKKMFFCNTTRGAACFLPHCAKDMTFYASHAVFFRGADLTQRFKIPSSSRGLTAFFTAFTVFFGRGDLVHL